MKPLKSMRVLAMLMAVVSYAELAQAQDKVTLKQNLAAEQPWDLSMSCEMKAEIGNQDACPQSRTVQGKAIPHRQPSLLAFGRCPGDLCFARLTL